MAEITPVTRTKPPKKPFMFLTKEFTISLKAQIAKDFKSELYTCAHNLATALCSFKHLVSTSTVSITMKSSLTLCPCVIYDIVLFL